MWTLGDIKLKSNKEMMTAGENVKIIVRTVTRKLTMKTRYLRILQQQSMVGLKVCVFFSRASADVFLQRLNHKERLQALAPRN